MANYEENIKAALAGFEKVLRSQLERVERINASKDVVDYDKLPVITIGICGGDGIGPVITKASQDVLEYLLADEVKSGKVKFKVIDGLTIENRVACMKAIPDDVMEELKSCDVILKGPTTTPRAGDPWPNIESANVAMRKALDLFANVRPVKVPDKGIDWTFFRENTEGTNRIARLAYEYARKNHKDRVSIVTKANIIKTTDGKFLRLCEEIAKEYPEITTDEWFIDIMTAKLVDEKRRTDFKVFVLPNLYGDIITDEAAEFQGGVGTAGSANIGKKYAMFEAIHGSAPRMVKEGRAKFADPCSMLRATVMLLSHIGRQSEADKLERALDICMFEEKKYVITGRDTGATCDEFAKYVMDTIKSL